MSKMRSTIVQYIWNRAGQYEVGKHPPSFSIYRQFAKNLSQFLRGMKWAVEKYRQKVCKS